MAESCGVQICIPVIEGSQVGEARRTAMQLAAAAGFAETLRAKVGIVVTEVANNLIQHTREGGEILLRTCFGESDKVWSGHRAGLEILALDKGPGMANVQDCMRDGYSTRSTAGTGLGAIQRLSSAFHIHSEVGSGTALLVFVGLESPDLSDPGPAFRNMRPGIVCLPRFGEEVCGDDWAMAEHSGRTLLCVADGLGHGPGAAQASRAAIGVFHANLDKPPAVILERAHAAIRSTRGAVMAVVELNGVDRDLNMAGIGNVSGRVELGDRSVGMVSLDGTLGHAVRKIQQFSYPWPQGAVLVLHSDGIGTRWDLTRHPGLVHRHPSLIAGVLYRDHTRGRDDATIVVVKERGGAA